MLMFTIVIFVCLGCSHIVDPESEEIVTEEEKIEDCTDHDYVGDYSWEASDEIQITLKSNEITVDGSGATANGNLLTITSAGTYRLTGSLENGQIIVNSTDEEIVRLILSGVDLNCFSNAPIYIVDAEKAMIVVDDYTKNSVTDGSSYILPDVESGEPNATIFSKCDLTIYGNGILSVDANYKDGIASKDGLIITSGTINVNAVDDGIRGKDYLIVKDGNITVDAGSVGLKSTNDNDATMGYITIENGVIDISADGEAIEAEKDVIISSGEITISSNGKGINSAISTTIDGGTCTINSVDDAIHSNGYVTINDGILTISSIDDAIHANNDLVINNGKINITKSYEGIESAEGDITINGGNIRLVSSDDGINLAAGGADDRWSSSTGSYFININGGYISVDASGDGIDANASVVMTDGDLIVSGSSATSNSALDYNGSFSMNGGFLVAAGSYSRMTQSLSTSSDQNSILVNLDSMQTAGKLIHIETQSGTEVLTFSPAKSYQSVAFSSSLLTIGTVFYIYLGGSSTGTETNGLYAEGVYSGGTLVENFTVSSNVTTIN